MSASSDTTSVQPARLLLVEDEGYLAEVLAVPLQEDQILLTHARDGRAALALLESETFDLALLDVGLPGMDGFELLQKLKADPRTKHLPVIMLTANNRTQDKVRGFAAGAADYVTKPFELIELQARLRAVLATQRLQRDLTEANHRLEAARGVAEEGARAKLEFLANMSHEIRTPMNGVIAMTGLLLQTELSTDQRDFVETIRTSGESLVTIINDILHVSKIQSGKLELESRPLNLRACVEDSLDVLAMRAGEKGLDLVCHINAHIASEVLGDATRLRQILVNLIGNAVKFTTTGEVFVHVRPTPPPDGGISLQSWLEFSVRDTGMGIPSDRLARLFHSFSQADSSIAREYGGTGLGLAISKGLVDLMGGRMWVESAEGTGSTFHFTLPLPPVSSSALTPATQAQPGLEGQRVLIVEDGRTSREWIDQLARHWGMKPSCAETVEQALAEVRGGCDFSIAIIDAQLPEKGAATLINELQRTARGLPLVLLASVGATSDVQSLGTVRSVNVAKPVKPASLLAAVKQVLSGARPVAPKVQPTARLDGAMAARLPLSVLLVDDNAINQKVATRLLQQLGYKADVARTGLEAIRALEKKPYDVIFMDVQMPEMDGLEATRQIRLREKQTPPPPHFAQPVVIIAMTANAMHGDREKCVTAGMDDYLPKPVRPETLAQMLERHGQKLAKSAGSLPATVAAQASPLAPSASTPAPVLTVMPSAATAEDAPVDIDRLMEFSGGSATNFNELITLYFKQTAEQLQQIREAVAAGQMPRVARVAHSCAGASATCGMNSIVPLLRQLEHLGQEGEASGAAALLPAVDQEFERLKNYVQTHKPIALAG